LRTIPKKGSPNNIPARTQNFARRLFTGYPVFGVWSLSLECLKLSKFEVWSVECLKLWYAFGDSVLNKEIFA
jgi:hypothetical protein